MSSRKDANERIILMPTFRCSVKCEGCITGDFLGEKHSDMELKTVMKVAKEVTPFTEISLAGGEPTLHRNFFQIVSILAARKPRFVKIITNGTTFNRDAESIDSFIQKLGILRKKTGTRIILENSVDPMHAEQIEDGENRYRESVQNIESSSKEHGIETAYKSVVRKGESFDEIVSRFGLPVRKTYSCGFRQVHTAGTMHSTFVTPDGSIHRTEADLVQRRAPEGNIRKTPLRTFRKR